MSTSLKLTALSYPLTRPFPFSRLTWSLILTSGIVLAVLFSFLAVATNAYEAKPEYRLDPNITEDERQWFQRKPFSLVSNLDNQCQDTQLTVGSKYMTRHTVLSYSLERLWQGKEDDSKPVAQIAYHNTHLDCQVQEIFITLSRMSEARLAGRYWTWGATHAVASTTCNITSPNGVFKADLRAELPQTLDIEQQKALSPAMHSDNLAIQYGARTTMAWYGQLPRAMSYQAPDANNESWSTGYIRLQRNPNVTDYRNPDYFTAFMRQLRLPGGFSQMAIGTPMSQWRTDLPPINVTVSAFALSFWSLLELDFGLNKDTNPLQSVQGVEFLRSINDTVLWNASHSKTKPASGDEGGTISPLKIPKDAKLNETQPTTVFAQYLCSIPQSKGGFAIFYAVVLAELVFISACWSLFGTLASWWLASKNPSANYCAGCISQGACDTAKGDILLNTRSLHDGISITSTLHPDDADDRHESVATMERPLLSTGNSYGGRGA